MGEVLTKERLQNIEPGMEISSCNENTLFNQEPGKIVKFFKNFFYPTKVKENISTALWLTVGKKVGGTSLVLTKNIFKAETLLQLNLSENFSSTQKLLLSGLENANQLAKDFRQSPLSRPRRS